MLSNNLLFSASLILNIILLLFFSFFVYKKGGIIYLLSKINNNSSYPSHYQLKMKQFEGLPNSEQAIIFLGDSLTEQGQWVELLGQVNIKNRGISGDTTKGVINRLEAIVSSKSQKIFLMIGINDLFQSPSQLTNIINNYKIILEAITNNTPNTQVYLQSILPINNEDFVIAVSNNDILFLNKNIEKLAQQFDYQYINLYDSFTNEDNQLYLQYTEDGVHLNSQGYLVWQQLINKYIIL